MAQHLLVACARACRIRCTPALRGFDNPPTAHLNRVTLSEIRLPSSLPRVAGSTPVSSETAHVPFQDFVPDFTCPRLSGSEISSEGPSVEDI